MTLRKVRSIEQIFRKPLLSSRSVVRKLRKGLPDFREGLHFA